MCIISSSREFYKLLIYNKAEVPQSERKLRNSIPQTNLNFNEIYTQKIKNIDDCKIKEFNYKVLHLILPCNENLYKWKRTNTNLCELCNFNEDIIHLLFDCQHAKQTWERVSDATSFQITKHSILFGTNNRDETILISIISYLIYKTWLISKNENVPRTNGPSTRFYIAELSYKSQVYSLLKRFEIVRLLNSIIYQYMY
jgi:hypothetical protein